jgi:hypothetical protein
MEDGKDDDDDKDVAGVVDTIFYRLLLFVVVGLCQVYLAR